MSDQNVIHMPPQPVELPRFVKLNEYLSLPREPQPWIIHSLVPIGGLVNIYGKPKTGKSFIALDWAKDVAAGKIGWYGYPIAKSGPVAYLQVDTPRPEWAKRLEEVKRQCHDEDIPLWIADMWLIPQFPMDLLNPDGVMAKWLKDQLDQIQPVMIVIDTLRETHSGDEDNSTVMRNVISLLVGACRPAAIVLVSHSRKDQAAWDGGGTDDLMDQARGSSYVAGRMDVICKVTQKQMQFKGRATGLVTEKLHQDPTTGFIGIANDEDGSEQVIYDIMKANPGMSLRGMAGLLMDKKGYSLSTAIRRINRWNEKHGVVE